MPTYPGTPAADATAAQSKFSNSILAAGYVPGTGVALDNQLFDVLGIQQANSVVETITAAGAVSVNTTVTAITGPAASTYAITLAAPPVAGRLKVITMTSTTSTNSVTLALTNVQGGSAATTATFDAAAETLILVSNGTKWVVCKESGVTLA